MEDELGLELANLGYASIAAWCAEAPTESLISLARRAPVRCSAVTLMRSLRTEAYASNDVVPMARAMFVRLLHDLDDLSAVVRYGKWFESIDVSLAFTATFDPEHRALLKQLWHEFGRRLETNAAWTPASADDADLVALFEPHAAGFERDPLRAKVEAIEATIDAALGGRGTIDALRGLPKGYRCYRAMAWVDAEVRNGGFGQLYRNTGGAAVPDAVAGHRAIGQDVIADLIAESLRYARTAEPALVHQSVQSAPELPGDATRTWGELDKAYYRESDAGPEALVARCGGLFDPSWRVLVHPDGRIWRIREYGERIELQIELPDGEVVEREVRLGLEEDPTAVVEQRLARQRELGFVENR